MYPVVAQLMPITFSCLDFCACFKMKQQVMLFLGVPGGNRLSHSFHMAAEQAEDSSSLWAPSSNPSSAGRDTTQTLPTVEGTSVSSDQCCWWATVERISWRSKGTEGMEKKRWHGILGIRAGKSRGHPVSVLRPDCKNCSQCCCWWQTALQKASEQLWEEGSETRILPC